MGRDYYSKRLTVEGCFALDSAIMQRKGLFNIDSQGLMASLNEQGEETVRISFAYQLSKKFLTLRYGKMNVKTGEKKNYDYEIQMITSPCAYGGVRYWFLCPSASPEYPPCQKRTRKLYLPFTIQAELFACRYCYNLTYKSCRHSHDEERYANGLLTLFKKCL